MFEASMFINGRPVGSEEAIAVRNPARTGEVVGTIPIADSTQVDLAVEAADAAFEDWSRTPIAERAALMRLAAERLSLDVDRRSELLSREGGALLAEAERSVRGASRFMSWYADLGTRIQLEEPLDTPNGRVIVTHQPMGVAAVIVPWNAPTNLGFLSIAPALVAGNTVVVKPPSDAPLTLLDMIAEVGAMLPPGVLNAVTGSGADVGTRLVGHPAVRKINFTGSTEAGKTVLRTAASTVKRVSLELGGNDPALVLSDADLDFAVPELVTGTFNNAGQICYAVKRVYVSDQIYPEFVERFVAKTNEIVVGEGLDARSTMGALINERQLRAVSDLVEGAKENGATVHRLGNALDDASWSAGNFHLPTVVVEVDQSDSVVQEEQFGPVIPILPFETEEEALRLANDSRYGLASSIWTVDEERAFDLARELQAGSTFVNIHRRGASGVDMPFGGFKESGIGRSHGEVAVREQMEMHTISSRRR